MHFVKLSEFKAKCQSVQQFGLVKLAVFIILTVQLVGATNYCSLCKNHVACSYNGNFGQTCSPDKAVLKMDSSQKEYIVKLHNRMRNKIAMGEIQKYSSAAKMPCLQWSDELAYLAELNVRSCTYGHDSCRATEKFPYAGQNIARRGNTRGYEKTKSSIQKMITNWFLEYKDADMSYIKSYHNHKHGKAIGHFTVMVNDKNNAVGCAMIRYKEKGFYYRYLVCNYGYTNVLGRPVYEKGSTGSKCKKRHPVYEGLCSTDQVVIPVP